MANNPHAETYKGSTTFSGPIKAGSRWLDVPNYDRETVPGTIAVKDLPNAGYVVCSQSVAVEQSDSDGSASHIVLPAGSMISSIQIIVTVPFDATDDKDLLIHCRTEVSVTNFTNYVKLGAVGVYDAADDSNWTTPGWIASTAGAWRDITFESGAKAGDSVDVATVSGPGGASAGRAILTISYIPGLHLRY